jgi:3-hydroxybutyryl-CoA dehydrogenase
MKVEEIKRIAVVGAGLMGQGAAVEFALGGYQVSLNSRSEASLQSGLKGIGEILQRLINLGLATQNSADVARSRIRTNVNLQESVRDVQVVYEVVYEDLALKQKVFRDLDRFCPKSTILVSGTSMLRLSDLAAATQRPDKVLLANYSNPSYLVPCAEVMRNEDSSDETVAVVCDLLTRIGKKPVVIETEVPGFVANRLQGALYREALWLVERGVITAQGVDTIIRTGVGRRWAVAGPFEIFELIGMDLVLAGMTYLIPHLENSIEIPQVLQEKLDRGELGVKTGKAFYDWTPDSEEALRQRIAHALVEVEKWFRVSS